jgi:hypothetical protein
MSTELLEAPPEPGSRLGRPNRHSKIDVAKALKMRVQGASLEDIGDHFGVTKQAVHYALTSFEPFVRGLEPGQLTAYSENRAELFNAVEQHLTASLLDPEAMAKASLNNRAYAFKAIHEARRLESGQSTNNISVLGKFLHDAESGLGVTAPQQRAVIEPKPQQNEGKPKRKPRSRAKKASDGAV